MGSVMHYSAIKNHLRPYVIVARRKTTINHAFAAAVAPSDEYSEERVRRAVAVLGQDPDKPLSCAYCGAPANTWDHVFATVKNSVFSGYGHRLGNLLPCCKPCNSAKGNKEWRSYLSSLNVPDAANRASYIQTYLSEYGKLDDLPGASPEYKRLLQIREQVLMLLSEADQISKVIRDGASV
jgi:hypothetical protein